MFLVVNVKRISPKIAEFFVNIRKTPIFASFSDPKSLDQKCSNLFEIFSGISEWLGQMMTGRAPQDMKYLIIQCTLTQIDTEIHSGVYRVAPTTKNYGM